MSVYTHTDADGDRLEIEDESAYGRAEVTARNKDDDAVTIYVSKEDAPRVALELLKAAGHKEDDRHPDSYGITMTSLKLKIQRAEERKARAAEEAKKAEEEATAKAAEDAKLDAEALKLYRAATSAPFSSFLTTTARNTWRQAALEARKIHAPAPELPRFEVLQECSIAHRGWGVADHELGRFYPYYDESAARRALPTFERGETLVGFMHYRPLHASLRRGAAK